METRDGSRGVVLTVDRPGPRGFVYVQDEDGHEALLPVDWLPGPAREGDVFQVSLREDSRLRDQRRAQVASLIEALSEDAGADDIEDL